MITEPVRAHKFGPTPQRIHVNQPRLALFARRGGPKTKKPLRIAPERLSRKSIVTPLYCGLGAAGAAGLGAGAVLGGAVEAAFTG